MTMLRLKDQMLLLATILAATDTLAFVPQSSTAQHQTALHALPPMIIGPMIKKMREEQAKKKMPMISADEQRGQAPGLRVGGTAWKWPPIWPYDQDFFTPNEDIQQPDPTKQVGGMAGMLTGVPQMPTADEVKTEDVETLDVMKFWAEDNANVKTELDEEAVEKLKSHFSFYLKPGMSILEFGAAENSYLPDDIKPSRHVGVGLNMGLMDENPSLTEKLIVDLNNVVPERDVDSDELRKLGSEPFDAILITNTIDFLTNPREVFRSAWYLLKPGGIMLVAFSSKNAPYANKLKRAQTKMWRNFNDDQHMWIAGSFFQFSAGDGWENLLAFDISPESAKNNLEDSGLFNMFKQGKDNNIYVVQASKGIQDEVIDKEDPAKSINSRMWMLPTMEDRDKQLVVPRLARAYDKAPSDDQKQSVADRVHLLPKVYEALVKMDQFAFTFPMQSQLAADLVLDPDFDANEEQMLSLRQGLGLKTPSAEFWVPVGETTAGMLIDDKINLLAHLVPRFGSGNADQEQALSDFASGLKPTMDVVRRKCPDMAEADVQVLGSELLCSEILIPGRSTKQEFATWLECMDQSDLEGILKARKVYNEESASGLADYRKKRDEELARLDELRKKYEEQVAAARKERTMGFNPRTGKFEEIKKK